MAALSRRLLLDDAPGEARGLVLLDGRPERLILERADDPPELRRGARLAARLKRLERDPSVGFLDLGGGLEALVNLSGRPPPEGAWLEVEILSPPRRAKLARAALRGSAEGPPRLLEPAPELAARLRAFAPGAAIETGRAAREAVDAALETALAVRHLLPSGGRLAIEPTQALTAIDVDLGTARGPRSRQRVNEEAVVHAARLLRLKGLGGLVALDLIGEGGDGRSLRALLETALAPDGEGARIGPLSRFGVIEFVVPRTEPPLRELLLDEAGAPTPRAEAFRLLRRIEDAAAPGRILVATAAPEVARAAEVHAPALAARIGRRFEIRADPGYDGGRMEVRER